MNSLTFALYVAAGIHFAILTASILTPKALDWKTALSPLPPLLRRMFWVYGIFIVVMIISFGVLTALHAPAMAAGAPVARSLAVVIAVFWALRLGVQCFVFDARPWLTRPLYRIGYHALTIAFVVLVTVYTIAAAGWGDRLPDLPSILALR